MSGELKPCPFCGGKAKLATNGFSNSAVICAANYCAQAVSVSVWNTRSAEAALSARVAELEGERDEAKRELRIRKAVDDALKETNAAIWGALLTYRSEASSEGKLARQAILLTEQATRIRGLRNEIRRLLRHKERYTQPFPFTYSALISQNSANYAKFQDAEAHAAALAADKERLREAQAETQRLLDNANDLLRQAMDGSRSIKPQIVAALTFYRDEFKPKIEKPLPGASGIVYRPSEALLDDCGNRAMDALAALEKGK